MSYEEIIEWIKKEKNKYIELSNTLSGRLSRIDAVVTILTEAINNLEKIDE